MSKRNTRQEPVEKQLWRLLAGLAAIQQASTHLRLLQDFLGNDDLEAAIWAAYFTTYAKPFTRNNLIQQLPQKHVPLANRELHKKILNIRNALYGHIDPSVKIDSGEKLHRMRLRVEGSKILPNPTLTRPAHEALPDFIDHTNAVEASLEALVQTFLNEHDSLPLNQDGDYEIDFQADEMIRRL